MHLPALYVDGGSKGSGGLEQTDWKFDRTSLCKVYRTYRLWMGFSKGQVYC